MSVTPLSAIKQFDFIRKSELSFSKTMKFILGMGSQTLGKELIDFYGYDPKMVSVSAIVQRRSKILPAAFQHLFHKFNKTFSQNSFFHGYRLYAALIFIHTYENRNTALRTSAVYLICPLV